MTRVISLSTIHTICSFPLDGILLAANLKDVEGLLRSLDTAENHGAKGRSCISVLVNISPSSKYQT